MYLRSLIPLLASALLFTGCATMELQTNVKTTKSVFLKPDAIESKTIYISSKSIIGDKLEILPLLKTKLAKKGYRIVENTDEANYVLMTNVLFANNLKEAHAVKAAAGMGITGGVMAAASGRGLGKSLLVGASFALASGLVGKALEDEIYRAVVDVVIAEKTDGAQSSVMGDGYKEHKTRILAEAVKTKLKLDEALPVLSEKIATQLSNIF